MEGAEPAAGELVLAATFGDEEDFGEGIGAGESLLLMYLSQVETERRKPNKDRVVAKSGCATTVLVPAGKPVPAAKPSP